MKIEKSKITKTTITFSNEELWRNFMDAMIFYMPDCDKTTNAINVKKINTVTRILLNTEDFGDESDEQELSSFFRDNSILFLHSYIKHTLDVSEAPVNNLEVVITRGNKSIVIKDHYIRI